VVRASKQKPRRTEGLTGQVRRRQAVAPGRDGIIQRTGARHLNRPFDFLLNRQVMISPDEPTPAKEAPKPKPSRSEEAPHIIEEYANDLREIIKKLRRLLN
jgi:hypothetical protein